MYSWKKNHQWLKWAQISNIFCWKPWSKSLPAATGDLALPLPVDAWWWANGLACPCTSSLVLISLSPGKSLLAVPREGMSLRGLVPPVVSRSVGLHVACLIHFSHNLLYNQLSVSCFRNLQEGGGKGKGGKEKKRWRKKKVNSFNKPNDISEEKFL